MRVWDPASGTLLACIASAALCTGGQFAMYSLVRHAPCVRAIALQRRTSGGGGQPRASGGGGGGPDSAVTSPSNVFMRTPSFTPNTPQLLQPSMTMYRERRGSTSGGAAASDFFAPSSSISGGYPSAYGASGPGSGAGQPPVLQTMMSMRSSFTTMEELPKLMELVTDSTCPMLAVYTPFVSPRSVALFKERIVMSDGPHIYFYEAGDPGVSQAGRAGEREGGAAARVLYMVHGCNMHGPDAGGGGCSSACLCFGWCRSADPACTPALKPTCARIIFETLARPPPPS